MSGTSLRPQEFLQRGRQDASGSVAATEALDRWKDGGVAEFLSGSAASAAPDPAAAAVAAAAPAATHGAMPLGKTVDYPVTYAPDILFPVPRAAGRTHLGLCNPDGGLPAPLPFVGVDVAHQRFAATLAARVRRSLS